MTGSSPATMEAAGPQARVAALVGQHGMTLLRVARKVSLCADDAQDAFQRALEIYLRRIDTLDPATEVAWMRVVVRNEALAVRRSRSQLVNGEEVDFDSHVDQRQRSLEERVESAERVTRSAEALRHLKHDEAQALMLKAEGLSYGEIGERLGWTYTKVNRCITEGRARFRSVFRGIESGEQCERFAPLLATLAGGEADAEDLVRLRPHLRHCGACRAEVRRLHHVPRRGLGAFLPLPAFLERLRPSGLRAELYGLLGRLGGADPVAGSLAGGVGGGRGVGATALIGLCLAGAGAGGYCAVGGPLPDTAAVLAAVQRHDAEPRRSAAAAVATEAAAAASERLAILSQAQPARPAQAQPDRGARVTPAPRRSEPSGDPPEEFGFEGQSYPASTRAESEPATISPPPAAVHSAVPAGAGSSHDSTAADSQPRTGEFGFER